MRFTEPPQDPVAREPGVGDLIRRVVQRLDIQGSSWEGVVRSAAEEMCQYLGASLAQVYFVDSAEDVLRHGGTWEARPDSPSLRAASFAEGAPLRRDQALPGRAWLTRRPVSVPDLRAEASAGRDQRRHHPDARAAVAIPLLAGGSVCAVLEFWLGKVGRPDARMLEELEPVARILGEALGRIRAEDRLAEAGDRFFVMIFTHPEGGPPREDRTDPIDAAQSLGRGGFAIVYASPSFCRMTGYTEAEIKGRSLRAFMGPKTDRRTIEKIFQSIARGERIAAEFVAYRRDGGEFVLRLEIAPVRDSRGAVSHFVVVPPDVVTAKGAGTLKRAEVDPLTGLANRVLLNDTLRRALERSEKSREFRFAVLFIDLDRFKWINDTFGHVVGDELLITVARQLEGAVRPGDVVSRFGGDEFVILLELVGGVRDVLTVAERIKDRLDRPLRLAGKEFVVRASIGIALSDTGYAEVEDVLRDADAAMYQAKERGGGYQIFDLALQDAALATQRIRAALQNSLERGEFRLHYQPLVDLASGRLAGLEALLRWQHPERGVVTAAEFIGPAEDMGLILPIGRWVIQEACRQIRAWEHDLSPGVPMVLNVNLSARELLDPGLTDWLRSCLEENGVRPTALRFEIPESFLARPRTEARAVLQPLLDLGIRIGIGDFGRGTSSFSHLYRFPVDLLKIDRQFVAELPEQSGDGDGGNERAVRSILALAKSLGMEVAAAGVETSRQRELLHELSCPYAQGNLFSVPVDAAGAEQLLSQAWGARAHSDQH